MHQSPEGDFVLLTDLEQRALDMPRAVSFGTALEKAKSLAVVARYMQEHAASLDTSLKSMTILAASESKRAAVLEGYAESLRGVCGSLMVEELMLDIGASDQKSTGFVRQLAAEDKLA